MSAGDAITFVAFFLYLLYSIFRGKKRPLEEADEAELEVSEEKLRQWRASLGIVDEPKAAPLSKARPSPLPKKSRVAAKKETAKLERSKNQRTLSNQFKFQATLHKYRRATAIEQRDYRSRIEQRKGPGRQVVSPQLAMEARLEDAYALAKRDHPSPAANLLGRLRSAKESVILSEILARPRSYLAPEKLPGYWWEMPTK